jgi:hypothetical protein
VCVCVCVCMCVCVQWEQVALTRPIPRSRATGALPSALVGGAFTDGAIRLARTAVIHHGHLQHVLMGRLGIDQVSVYLCACVCVSVCLCVCVSVCVCARRCSAPHALTAIAACVSPPQTNAVRRSCGMAPETWLRSYVAALEAFETCRFGCVCSGGARVLGGGASDGIDAGTAAAEAVQRIFGPRAALRVVLDLKTGSLRAQVCANRRMLLVTRVRVAAGARRA